jgi:hypothetical protein
LFWFQFFFSLVVLITQSIARSVSPGMTVCRGRLATQMGLEASRLATMTLNADLMASLTERVITHSAERHWMLNMPQ